MQLSGDDKQVLWNALAVAATRFDEDAKLCDEYPNLREQFTRQAAESRKLLDKLEDDMNS